MARFVAETVWNVMFAASDFDPIMTRVCAHRALHHHNNHQINKFAPACAREGSV